jgi:hypothetical protein
MGEAAVRHSFVVHLVERSNLMRASAFENGDKRRVIFRRQCVLFLLLAIALLNYSKGFVNQIQHTYVQG